VAGGHRDRDRVDARRGPFGGGPGHRRRTARPPAPCRAPGARARCGPDRACRRNARGHARRSHPARLADRRAPRPRPTPRPRPALLRPRRDGGGTGRLPGAAEGAGRRAVDARRDRRAAALAEPGARGPRPGRRPGYVTGRRRRRARRRGRETDPGCDHHRPAGRARAAGGRRGRGADRQRPVPRPPGGRGGAAGETARGACRPRKIHGGALLQSQPSVRDNPERRSGRGLL
jgi:translation initiation factor IF-2